MRWFGDYGKLESFISLVAFISIFCIDFNYVLKGLGSGYLSRYEQVIVLFFNIIGLMIISLPVIMKFFEKIESKKIKIFLDLPQKNTPFTFTTVSSFLSEQALVSFLATVLVLTSKFAILKLGIILGVIYISFLFIFTMILAVISLTRFILFFSKYSPLIYSVVVSISTFIVFCFINIGFSMGII